MAGRMDVEDRLVVSVIIVVKANSNFGNLMAASALEPHSKYPFGTCSIHCIATQPV